MARRGRSPSPAPRRSSVPAKTAPRSVAPQQQPTQVGAPAPQQPGLFAQMAATAGGVAVGSAIGHTVGHAVTGLFSGGSSHDEVPQQVQPIQSMPVDQSNQQGGACAFEIKQFLQCAQNTDDISLCSGFNEAIRQCKEANGLL
ncbi:coiled-coil-helix-coiled-coil-helix domain-containing protein 2 [Daktulosphaira vitifoliae]|uniref:coiled-coil-helix-coiled-coil-helix domain-containing protein 2 n=1 Tax=Daktulosphaira vitifoliae TaxID=58002 RepID=UPI0021AAFB52|nr:coiled-coil-helix-coiled-coil-helix domain-containing protein 2 [Daktulosphaira vitifoliae]